jgi:hypothetical protein
MTTKNLLWGSIVSRSKCLNLTVLRAGLETGERMGLAHRAITPLPSRHHLGPLLAVCPSTPPPPMPFIALIRFPSISPGWYRTG